MIDGYFLDSTAAIKFSFGCVADRTVVGSKLSKTRVIISAYVLFEIARGYTRNLILLHNKCAQLGNFSELMKYARVVRLKSHFQGTILGAMERYFEGEGAALGLSDKERLIHFRAFARRLIRRGWKTLRRIADLQVNRVGCREGFEDPTVNLDGLFVQELALELCGIHSKCGLKAYAVAHRADLERLRQKLKRIPDPDEETNKRIRSLRDLYGLPIKNFPAGVCYSCGDAVIAHECPSDSTILTNNRKHFDPISSVFGKAVEYFEV